MANPTSDPTGLLFKVGDVCTVRQCPCHPRQPGAGLVIGQEITILSVDPSDRDGLIYETDVLARGYVYPYYWARQCYLELKRPPRQEVGTWGNCVWKPELEHA